MGQINDKLQNILGLQSVPRTWVDDLGQSLHSCKECREPLALATGFGVFDVTGLVTAQCPLIHRECIAIG